MHKRRKRIPSIGAFKMWLKQTQKNSFFVVLKLWKPSLLNPLKNYLSWTKPDNRMNIDWCDPYMGKKSKNAFDCFRCTQLFLYLHGFKGIFLKLFVPFVSELMQILNYWRNTDKSHLRNWWIIGSVVHNWFTCLLLF